MKYLILVAVLLVVYLLWRNARRAPPADGGQVSGGAEAPALPQDMVRCQVCALHLPRAEALLGDHGDLYCSQEHRLSANH